jgi:hypothetical protein
MEMSGQLHALATHSMRRLVGTRPHLDAVAKKKEHPFTAHAANRTPLITTLTDLSAFKFKYSVLKPGSTKSYTMESTCPSFQPLSNT